jgi:hypothetical protein
MLENSLTFQDLPARRRITESISQSLQQRLTAYLDTLKPLLAPERVFGRHVGGKTDVLSADKAVTQVKQSYAELVGKPLDLPRDFEPDWLKQTGGRLELHRVEYMHEASRGGAQKSIRITSPVRWVLAFGSAITPFQAVQIAMGKEREPAGALKQYVANALVMEAMLARNPGLVDLFNDLRFELRTEHFPETGKLPFASIVSCIPSFRPSDELILAATEFSGVPAFIELVDLQALETMRDPLKQRIEALTAS